MQKYTCFLEKGGNFVIYVGDYFALILVATLFLFFVDTKTSLRYMSASSKLYISSLLLTAATAVTDLLSIYMLSKGWFPLWQNVLVNTAYFIFGVLAVTSIALYMFTRILEHTHEKHCMRRAHIGLAAAVSIYVVVAVANIWTGWIFSFDEIGNYVRGPLNSLGYIIALGEMAMVIICFFRNKKTAGGTVWRVISMICPIIPLCVLVNHLAPEIMMNSFILALVDGVLFIAYQGQRHGVHSLTKLNDRYRFFTEVDYRIGKGEPFQIFLINLKNFGTINQKFGNNFGDEILYHFAFALESLLPGSITFHMNGTVFAMVMRYTYQSTSEKQCGAVLDFMEKGIEFTGHQINFDYSVAHYVADGEEKSASDLYETLEYSAAKARRMNHRYIRCGSEDSAEMARKRYIIEKLRNIDREHGYEVWFQPTKCLATEKFCSMEALVRLRDTDGKLISPGEFIPIAEQTGMISPVTWFVVEEVCHILKTNPEFDNVSVSINVPQTQFFEKGFIPRFTGIVDQAGIDHRRICIEFTERTLLDNFGQTLEIMTQLTQEGFHFYLDDFGVGYSNFNCLLQLPFQVIKLDPCLVRTGKDGKKDYSTLGTLTDLFHGMDLIVIAEGAETEEEVKLLTENGVDRIQGFALARPMPVEKLLEFYGEKEN